MPSSTSTVPGRASEVRRAAMLTVAPSTSPSRVTTSPYATPARTAGNGSSSSAPMVTSRCTIRAAAAGVSATRSTSSPMFLMTRPPWSTTTSVERDSKVSIQPTSSASRIERDWEVKPTMSTKATA